MRLNRTIIGTVAIILALCTEAHAQTQFADTRAAQAFKAENYDLALEEFNKLAQSNPDNPLILRYLAITQRMLGQFDQAIQSHLRAVKIAPDNPANHYHLGVTYYLSLHFEAASESFKRVLELSPETDYAKLGHQYLDAIRDELELIAKRQGVRHWSMYAQLGLGYDSNVSALPDLPEFTNTDMDSGSGNGYLSLRGYFLKDYENWLGTAEVSGYVNGYTEDDFQSLDTGTYSGRLALQNTGSAFGKPYITEAGYTYQHVDIDRDVSYSRSNIAHLMGKLYWANNYAAKFEYKFSDDDFAYEGPDPDFTSRDGKEHKFSLIASLFSTDGLKIIDIGAIYATNSARGVNFDSTGYRIFLEGEIPLIWDIRSALKFSYGQDDYPNFSGPEERETDLYGVELRFTRWLGSRFILSADFGYHKEESNYETLSYDKMIAAFNIGFSY